MIENSTGIGIERGSEALVRDTVQMSTLELVSVARLKMKSLGCGEMTVLGTLEEVKQR